MAVRKLATGKWEADVTVGYRLDGSRDRRREIHPTKAKAEKAESRLKLIKEQKKGKSYGGILFEDFVRDYFWPQKTKLRSSTVRGYKRDLKLRLLPSFGSMPIEDINRYDIQTMISNCATKKVATNARETLSTILRLALEMEVIDRNPASYSYEYPDESPIDPDRYGVWLQSFEEIKRVVEYVCEKHPNSQVARIVVLGLCFGLRKGEILGLDWKHVDLKKQCIYIRQTYTEGEGAPKLTPPKTPKAVRTVPMLSLAYKYMAEWTRDAESVVATRTGKRLDPKAARDRVNKVFRTEKFDDGTHLPRITAFSMRHSFGTSCIDAGVEVAKVSAWMGHKDVTTTYNRYVKPRLEALANDASKIDQLMGF